MLISAQLRAVPAAGMRSLGASTILIMVATFSSTVLGFGREVVNANYFGAEKSMDTYAAASAIPIILFGVFTGALLNALVPTFAEYLARGEEEQVVRLSSTILNLLFLCLSGLVVLGWIFAPSIVPLIAPGFADPQQLAMAVDMTRWFLPSFVASSLSGAAAAVLNATNRFAAPALQGIALNIVTIGTVVMLNRKMGVYALVLGTVMGLFAQLLVQLPSIVRYRLYRFVLDLRHPGLKKVWWLLAPIIVGSAAGQISLFFDRWFGSRLAEGNLASMSYAVRLVYFPQQIFAVSIATVIFPLLASQFAVANRVGVRRSVVMGLRMVFFITIPSVVGLMALAQPIVATLFERGAFTEDATRLTASILPYAAVGLIAIAANVVLTRCSYACMESRLPVAFSIVAIIVNIALSAYWLPTLGARGLLLANSISQTLQMGMFFVLIWRLLHGLDWKALATSLARISACSLAMLLVLHWIAALGVMPQPTLVSRAWFLFGQLAIGSLVFVAVARLIGVEELSIAARTILQKFERRVPTPPENRGASIG